MHSFIDKISVKTAVWWLSKTMRHGIQGLNVDEKSVTMLKDLMAIPNKKVVLMPIYKSFGDAFIFVFLHHHYGIEAPFIFGNKEDELLPSLQRLLQRIGYVSSRRSYNQSVQSRYINSSMLREIIENNKLTMVF